MRLRWPNIGILNIMRKYDVHLLLVCYIVLVILALLEFIFLELTCMQCIVFAKDAKIFKGIFKPIYLI